ncbi:MAG: hypothetical protein HKN32_05970 [Flavobacteriales bacterium]|nr:hypothetical protein [Flavobacteriales bacterium]
MGKRLRFTNFFEHQGDSRYLVYEFFHEHIADHFEALLQERNVEFERFLDEENDPPITLFGVNKRFRTQSDQCNYLTHAHFRNPMIGNSWLRWGLVIFGIALVTFALIGYILSK